MKTDDIQYTSHLSQQAWWKRALDVQRPYRNHLQSLNLGRVLEIGCGIGRNLVNLGGSPNNIGIDHNPTSIEVAKSRGLTALLPAEFKLSEYSLPDTFDSLLVAHVLEHLTVEDAINLIVDYLPYIISHGKVVIITPQEAGFASDPTHVTMMNHKLVASILEKLQVKIDSQYSFPFPKWVGKIFPYNENVTIGSTM